MFFFVAKHNGNFSLVFFIVSSCVFEWRFIISAVNPNRSHETLRHWRYVWTLREVHPCLHLFQNRTLSPLVHWINWPRKPLASACTSRKKQWRLWKVEIIHQRTNTTHTGWWLTPMFLTNSHKSCQVLFIHQRTEEEKHVPLQYLCVYNFKIHFCGTRKLKQIITIFATIYHFFYMEFFWKKKQQAHELYSNDVFVLLHKYNIVICKWWILRYYLTKRFRRVSNSTMYGLSKRNDISKSTLRTDEKTTWNFFRQERKRGIISDFSDESCLFVVRAWD